MRRGIIGVVIGIGLALTLFSSVAAAPAQVFVDDDNACAEGSKQVGSLPASSGIFYVWLNTGASINSTDVYNLVLVPLFPGGTTLVGPQPVNFFQCSSSLWAYAEVAYGGFVPGRYAWLVNDPSGALLGADTVRYK